MIKERKASAEYLELFAWVCIIRGVISTEQSRSLMMQFMRWGDPVWQLVASKVEESTPTKFLPLYPHFWLCTHIICLIPAPVLIRDFHEPIQHVNQKKTNASEEREIWKNSAGFMSCTGYCKNAKSVSVMLEIQWDPAAWLGEEMEEQGEETERVFQWQWTLIDWGRKSWEIHSKCQLVRQRG